MHRRDGPGLSGDARALLSVQALRAAAYGLGSVTIGLTLEREGLSGAEVGLVLAAILAGSALASLLLARYAERVGRRRAYRLLLLVMGIAGTVFALTAWPPALVLAALTGTLSTDANDSGPMTVLETAMLPHTAPEGGAVRLFGLYNTVAVLAGALGALAAGLPGGQRLLFAYAAAATLGLAAAGTLSAHVEAGPRGGPRPALHRSKRIVARLSALFALDSFGGGFVVQSFLAYWLARKFDASPQLLGAVFFTTGLLQAVSFQAAVWLAGRIGLIKTMVFTHLPSNVLLAAVPFAPNLGSAIAVLFARFALSQMDVPTRQAYVVGAVEPDERVAAAAYTSTARAVTRPVAPLVAGPLLQSTLAAPFLIAGGLKIAYDIALYAFFRDRDRT